MTRCPSCDQMVHSTVTGPDGDEYCATCAVELGIVNPMPRPEADLMPNGEPRLASMLASYNGIAKANGWGLI